MRIVYCSKTGFSKHYAEMLSSELGCDMLDYKSKKEIKKDEEIIYVGWVFANKVKKLSSFKKYNIKAVLAVGMTPKSDAILGYIKEANKKTLLGRPVFYAQGGLDREGHKGFHKMLLKMVAKSVIQENKYEDRELISIFKNGGDFVSLDNLTELIEYIKN
jgi:flavodoxin